MLLGDIYACVLFSIHKGDIHLMRLILVEVSMFLDV